MDRWFGTFRDKLKENNTTYNGGSEEKTDSKFAAIHDRKAALSSKILLNIQKLILEANILEYI